MLGVVVAIGIAVIPAYIILTILQHTVEIRISDASSAAVSITSTGRPRGAPEDSRGTGSSGCPAYRRVRLSDLP